MTITKEQAIKLLFECSTVTLGIGEGSEEVITTTKLGVILISKGIEPYKLSWWVTPQNTDLIKNSRKAGEFLKEWGELLLSEEPKKDGES